MADPAAQAHMRPKGTTGMTADFAADAAADAMARLVAIHDAAEGRALTNAQSADFRANAAIWNEWADDHYPSLRLTDQSPEGDLRRAAQLVLLEQRAQSADTVRDRTERATAEHGSSSLRRLRPGEIRTLSPTEQLTDLYDGRTYGDIGFGDFARAAVTGNWERIPNELRFLSVGIGSAGGYTVPDVLSARIIDRARAASVVIRSGATTVPMDSAELTIARLSSGATTGWKSEGAAITAGDPAWERVILRAKTLAALTWMTVELFEDSPSAADTLERELAAALAVELDRAALFGSGAAQEPLGVANQSGIGTTAVAGAFTYDTISTGVQGILTANHVPDSLYMAPRSWGSLDRFKDGNGLPLPAPPSSASLAKYVTTSVPITQGSGSDTTLTIGKGSAVLIGVRTNLQIEVTRQAADASNNAFSEMLVGIRAYLRADVGLTHPGAFHTLTGVTN